jgi:predicted  nucleic acid-binding Zn-ribbon protein
MSASPHKPASPEVDLEATAELPLMDFETASDGATDTFLALPVPEEMPDLAESLRDVESHLQRKTERVRELEGERTAALLAAENLTRRLVAAEQALVQTRSALEAGNSELAATRARLVDQEQQVAGLRSDSSGQAASLRDQARDMEELRQRTARQEEALRHSQGFRGVLEALLADREHEIDTVEARHAARLAEQASHAASQLQDAAAREAALAAQLESLRTGSSARIAELEAQLDARSGELGTANQQLEAARRRELELATDVEAQRAEVERQLGELTALRANEEAAHTCLQQFQQQQDRIRALEGELSASHEHSAQLQSELSQAKDRIGQLESDMRANASMLGNLRQNMARLGREETGSRPVLKLVGGADPVPERFLVSEDEGSDVSYPLGRRSTLGRTPDNDIQIDASWISRRHAVILSSPQHCIIEDLDSMNGVLVNGRRVTRQLLRNGDVVMVGRSRFRYRDSAL